MQEPYREKFLVGTANMMIPGSASTITPMTTPGDAAVARNVDDMESEPTSIDQILAWDDMDDDDMEEDDEEEIAAQVLSSLSSVSTIVPVAPSVKRSDARRSATKSRSPPSAKPMQRRGSKSHVPSACINCKKAHLACDLSRPCKRCTSLGKESTCHDVQHKKRGRPKLKDSSPRKKDAKPASVYTSTMSTSAAISAAAAASQSTVPSLRKVHLTSPGMHYQLPNRPYDGAQNSPPKRSLLEKIPLIRTVHKQRQQQLHSALMSPSPPRPSEVMSGLQYAESPLAPSLRALEPILTPASSTPSPTGVLMALRAGAAMSLPTSMPTRREVILTLIMTANDLTIARASDEAAILLQTSPHQLQGKSMLDLIHASDRERLLHLRERVLLRAGISPAHFEHDVDDKFPRDASYLATLEPRELSRGAIGWPLPVFNVASDVDHANEFTDTLHMQVLPFMERERLFNVRMRVGGGGYRVDVSLQQHLRTAGCLVVEIKEFGMDASASSSNTSVPRHTLPKPLEPWKKMH